MKPKSMCTLTSLATLTLLLACGRDLGELPSEPGPSLTAHRSSAQLSPWSEPVNLGPVVNSSARDINGTLSPDGRSLYFVSNRLGGLGNNDIWVSRRSSVAGAWETPMNLGSVINSASDDGGVSLSDDGRMLFFNSNRPGGEGAADLYVSRRTDTGDDFGWGPPANLGPIVNTPAGERGPDYVAGAGGRPSTLYFNRGDLSAQQADLYAAPMTRHGEPLGPAELLADLSAPDANDAGQSVRGDGREILFWSNRGGTSGPADIWVSTRSNVHDTWSTPENVGAPLNTEFAEERPNLSRDGRTLLFDSDRPGAVGGQGQDIWMSTRTRLNDDFDDVRIDDTSDDNEGPRFSQWSAPVNLGPIMNTAFVDSDPFISKDGLSLYFIAGQGRGGSGGRDIWVSRRASADDPWGPPQNLGATVNSAGQENAPTLSLDGHRLYFASSRPGGVGGFDLYVSRRQDKRDDFGWEAPVNLGDAINTTADETAITFFEGTAYIASNRAGGLGLDDIYASTVQPDQKFGPAALVAELSTTFNDRHPAIRWDGLEIFLGSDRPGTFGNTDLWVATRGSVADVWSAPVNLGPIVNSPPRPPDVEQANDFRPALSFDGTTLYFAAALRPGNVSDMFDLWVTTRSRLKGLD